ncbi:4-hydroxythreonine-4-phosphate dehydrogenase PdxA [Gracilibacillus phocaeensis]|uniref:4-hydroxythreonine-4-phosphate dehydrogenase PdxA n=1 Tax=Gracilibacillus phocaeensis TaxID=2042304 RepID=UPI001030A06B|nr:4-hydroxythreonine-4-phosphate dehydrogenase PdxA [Gracilibacillus phocaeensis]
MIGITMGDANGIGPEIILKAYQNKQLSGEFIVIGDFTALEYCNKRLNYQQSLHLIDHVGDYRPNALNILDMNLLRERDIKPGELSRKVAAASKEYIIKAVHLALANYLNAIVTLPVNKEAVRLSDPYFTGHTELIAFICQKDSYTMMLVSDKLIVTHVNTHISMKDSIKNITRQKVGEVIKLTYEAIKQMKEKPKIAVAGLNPHAGEGGAFGKEEIEEIRPAVEECNRNGTPVEGPISPDTVFHKAVKGEFDAVVCMYHDQGHIPMKLLSFDTGVNVTLGLQVLRTSVDHGTAFDIAYQGKADTNSLMHAYRYAEHIKTKGGE